jgi:hypothetical protein
MNNIHKVTSKFAHCVQLPPFQYGKLCTHKEITSPQNNHCFTFRLCSSFRVNVKNISLNKTRLKRKNKECQEVCCLACRYHSVMEISVHNAQNSRYQWAHCQRRGPAPAHLLGLRFRIPPWEWMPFPGKCCVYSDRGLCVKLIACAIYSVSEGDRESSTVKMPWHTRGCRIMGENIQKSTRNLRPCSSLKRQKPLLLHLIASLPIYDRWAPFTAAWLVLRLGWRNGLQYGEWLRIYWINSRQPTRGGPPAWSLGGMLTTLHRKIVSCYVSFARNASGLDWYSGTS